MATSKLQALWNHPAGPKTSQFFSAKKLFFSFAELCVPSLSIQTFFRSDRIRSATKKISPEIVFDSDLRVLYIKQSNLILLISFICVCVFFFINFLFFTFILINIGLIFSPLYILIRGSLEYEDPNQLYDLSSRGIISCLACSLVMGFVLSR